MKAYVLGSGSRGNAVLVDDGVDAVLLDAGFGPRTIVRRARMLGLPLVRLRAVVLTHEHRDHVRGAAAVAARFAVPIAATAGTWRCLRPAPPARTRWIPLPSSGATAVGGLRIRTAPLAHDAVEPVALAVEGRGGETVALAHDLGHVGTGVAAMLERAGCLILEANHDEGLLSESSYPQAVQQRIASSDGHLSNRSAAAALSALCHRGLSAVVLAHLSARCNTPARARGVATAALARAGFQGTLHVAEQRVPLGPIVVGSTS